MKEGKIAPYNVDYGRLMEGEPDGLEKRLRVDVRNLTDVFATKILQQGHKGHVVEQSKLFPDTAYSKTILESEFLKRHVNVLAPRERNIASTTQSGDY